MKPRYGTDILLQKTYFMEPSVIEYKNYKFVILPTPTSETTTLYTQQLQKFGVQTVVRFRSFDAEVKIEPILLKNNISTVDFLWENDHYPSNKVIKNWLTLLKQLAKENHKKLCVATHCGFSSMRNSPVMIAIALMELGMVYEDAVELIREKRNGSFSTLQLRYLEKYKSKKSLKNKYFSFLRW